MCLFIACTETIFGGMPFSLPSDVKASKSSRSEAMPAKGSLTSGKQTTLPVDNPAQPHSEVDVVDFYDFLINSISFW